MRLVKPKAELLPWFSGIEGIYKTIELAGRTCYKSESKITEGSAKPFVDRMINSSHYAMLEHGTVYLFIANTGNDSLYFNKYSDNKYSKVQYDKLGYVYVTTNFRVLVENDWLDDLKYLCDPTEYHEMRYSFKLITSIGVTREMNRHRVNSIAEMSTRYCNYSKEKFNNQVSFCIPEWLAIEEQEVTVRDLQKTLAKSLSVNEYFFLSKLLSDEKSYMILSQHGWQPQQAREVLPLCTATEIVHTAFASDWKHFFDLRLFGKTGAPHPNMKQLAELMKIEAEKQGVWEDIMKV